MCVCKIGRGNIYMDNWKIKIVDEGNALLKKDVVCNGMLQRRIPLQHL